MPKNRDKPEHSEHSHNKQEAYLSCPHALHSLIILFLVLLLPFISGYTPLLEWRGLRVTMEGLQAALLVATRFFCILSLAVVFLGTTPLLVNIKAIQAMGLPYIMADMALLVVRYIEVLSADLRRVRISMRLRGHAEKSCSWQNLRTMAWLTGSLILRSYERSQSVYKAMRLRGYGHAEGKPAGFKATRKDIAGLCTVYTTVVMLVVLEFRL
ncbi:cobalt/nickel transport system permease protein [Desulfonatronum thiosulfatophilum]|uniref:Cobalt/nickel transport system permease protein n=1 Tax=Desulfonatronum thiosulfatophilum TaxID=617002 RepID=A0A1G6CTU8_9BACT|nr:energy-coupling factor transporter transmembrane component T [Desulfonatronum thiosulfatophilum]SDB36185.1 cobalt/nickel transport system permease protein [Desulfonatronum thiosulfatophilum]